MGFSPDQQWLITSSNNQLDRAKVWDLSAMRRELSQRGLDFPAEVLRALECPPTYAGEIEVRLEPR